MSTEGKDLEPVAEVVDGELVDRLLVPIHSDETYVPAIMERFRERVDNAREDSLATFQRRRELVNYPFDRDADEKAIEATVRTIAMWGARFALGMMVNPDREPRRV